MENRTSAVDERLLFANSCQSTDTISPFLNETLRGNDKRALASILSTLQPKVDMSTECRIAVGIPAHASEMNLYRTLREYVKQDAFTQIGIPEERFELFVLVNAKKGTDLTESPAFRATQFFAERYPAFPLVVGYHNYTPEELKIGRIRKHIAAVQLQRAVEANIDPQNLVLLTNDADLQKIPANYLDHIMSRFANEPGIKAMTGHIDYPKEDLDAEHVFAVMQRFSDIYEAIGRGRHRQITLRAGNSAMRASAYIESGGFQKSQRAEYRPMRRYLGKTDRESIVFERRGMPMNIVTSARRQIVSVQEGVPISRRYYGFASDSDIASKYKVPMEEFRLPEHHMKFTSQGFCERVRAELDARFHDLARSYPSEVSTIQAEMKLAAVLMGMKISFRKAPRTGRETPHVKHIVEIDNTAKLKKKMAAQYNRY